MTAYETYKDSGIDWIEKIPSHWEVWPFKHHYRFEKGKNAQKYTQDYIGLNSGEYPVYSGQTENEGVMGTINSYEYVFNEPVLFSTTVGAKAMTLITLNGKFSLSQNCALFYLRKKNRLDFKYGFYYTQRLFDYEKGLIALSMQPSLRFEDLQKYSIIIPPLPEQRQIAAYLNYKTNQIDRFIANRKKQIELLEEQKEAIINKAVIKGIDPKVKLKPSGVNWIGDIPEHWSTSRLKMFAKIFSGGTPDKSKIQYWTNGTIPWVGSGEVNQREVTEATTYITEDAFNNSSAKWIPIDSLIIALAGQGRTKGMVATTKIRTTCNQSLAAIIPKKSFYKFLYYWIFSKYKDIRGLVGEDRDGLNLEMIGNIPLPLPNIEEQKKIANHIDTELSERNELISKYQKQIDLMQEYKTSLISKAVTGKIDVREWQPKQPIKETV